MATEDTVNTIAKALGEADEQPLSQITGVVRVLGDDVSLAVLAETQKVEQSGGMLLPDNSRRRTPGGVFFFLARQKLSQDDKLAIFRPPKRDKPPAAEPAPFARRRVIEVAPAKEAPRAPKGGFIPPGLPLAAKRVRARETVQNAIAALPPDDQLNLLLDILAEHYERRGMRVPAEPQAAQRGPTSSAEAAPPPSQRPIAVPAAPVAAAPPVPAPEPPPPEPVREEAVEPPSSEAAPRRTAATRAKSAAARPSAKRRA